MSSTSALEVGLVGCAVCSRVAPIGDVGGARAARCADCGASLHARKPHSLSRTSALLLAAALLYVPANLLPIMTYRELGIGEPNTILSGCRELVAEGLWSLAAIVFTASIVVPVLKLIGLSALVWSVRRRSRWRPLDRTRLYEVVEWIGRWSRLQAASVNRRPTR